MKRIPVFYEYDHRMPVGSAIVDSDGNATIFIHDKEAIKILQGDELVALSLMGSYRRRHTDIIEQVDADESKTDMAIQTPKVL